MTKQGPRALRWFFYGREIDQAEAERLEESGEGHVIRGASGIVPAELRKPGESSREWVNPWGEMGPGPSSHYLEAHPTPTPAAPGEQGAGT